MTRISLFLSSISISFVTACSPVRHTTSNYLTNKGIATTATQLSAQPTRNTLSSASDVANHPKLRHELRFPVTANLPAHVTIRGQTIQISTAYQKPISLISIHPPLFANWRDDYLKAGDYDKDGFIDLAILMSVDHGGQNRCYAIYRYNPVTRQFRTRKSFDRCNIQ